MPTQAQIDDFTLAFHRQAIARMRKQPQLVEQALQVLERWQAQRGLTASEPYLQQWKTLLSQGLDALEQTVCQTNDHAATLRNVSPLGFVLSRAERMQLRHVTMARDGAGI